MKTAIVKISDLSIATMYDGSAAQASYGGDWGRPEMFEHVEFDDGVLDSDMVKAEDQAAEVTEQAVTFTADATGEDGNSISLTFDGVDDIDTVVGAWNTANPTNTCSHNGTGTNVLTSATVSLVGGGFAIVSDSTKLQTVRNMKLVLMRSQREAKYAKADAEIRMHDDGDVNKTATLAGWQTYRIALRDCTDTYKDTDPMVGTAALDSLAKDLSDFTWPTEPS